ncbi:MAG TPA: metalloregulator ArsR/SmtB family transcription factor [Vicinamibacterales bacterium]|nr:metalloregulator ArsR/SmtB family transcription factor [Vicinamibacterales bacterium]
MPPHLSGSSVFTAIADPTRRAILWSLRDGERTVSELMDPVDVSQSAFSQHLGVLRDAGLVHARREGRHQVYSVNPEALFEVATWIGHFSRFWDERLDRLGRHLDRRARARKH